MGMPLGPQIYEFGTFARLILFKNGFKIKKGKKIITDYWENVLQLRFHWLKETRMFITTEQYIAIWIDFKDGRTYQMKFQKFGALLGLEHLIHTRSIKGLIEGLRFLPVPVYRQEATDFSADMLEWELPEKEDD